MNDAPRSSRAYAKGFTLIEILVVVTIIAIVTGGALLSFGLIGATGGAARDVERLQSLLVDARDRAELENRDYGVRLLPDGYEFLAFDSGVGRWLSVDDRLFRAARWSVPVDLELDIEGRRVVLPRESSEGSGPVPDFGVDATGEFTPFELRLRTAAPSARWRLGIDEDGELALREDGAP